MSTALERREFTRVKPHIAVRIDAGEAGRFRGETHDISMAGVLLGGVAPGLLPGQPCQVVLRLHEGLDEIRIETAGEVVRVNGGGIAIRFTEILGIESYEHLRALILYNADDADRVEEEMSHHRGLRVSR